VTDEGHDRVVRGGSWNNNARNCRAAYRNTRTPGNRNNNIGFRVAAAPAAASRRQPEQVTPPAGRHGRQNPRKERGGW
jgi:hypothetical protein